MTTQQHTRHSAPTGRWLLALGDLAVFVAFAALGRRSHGEAAGLAAFAQVLETAAPFALGWLAVAPWLGAFRPEVMARPQAMLQRSLLAWVLALPIGLVLRMLFRQSAFPPLSFAVTTLLIVGVMLAVWRGGFAVLMQRRMPNGH